MRIFGGERITGIMNKLGMEEGEPIEHNLISRAIENAQSKVEAHNFDIRKHLLEYDDVMNQQREVIYKQRREALDGSDLKDAIEEMVLERAEETAGEYAHERLPASEWDLKGLHAAFFKQFNQHLSRLEDETLDGLTEDGLAQLLADQALENYNTKESEIGAEQFRELERVVMLQVVDNLWKDHLLSMDHLKEGIGLRGYAQQNPLIVYKKEGFEMFNDMIRRVKEETLGILFRIQIAQPEEIDDIRGSQEQKMVFSHGDEAPSREPKRRESKKIGRNSPCPCGSGKKYKKCCGR